MKKRKFSQCCTFETPSHKYDIDRDVYFIMLDCYFLIKRKASGLLFILNDRMILPPCSVRIDSSLQLLSPKYSTIALITKSCACRNSYSEKPCACRILNIDAASVPIRSRAAATAFQPRCILLIFVDGTPPTPPFLRSAFRSYVLRRFAFVCTSKGSD